MNEPNLSPRTISDKYRFVDASDAAALEAALKASLTGTSDTVSAYEARLAAVFRSKHALAVSSGGAALSVSLFAAGVQPGDEVILTPTSPLCTVYPILAAQAVPVFCDTQADNFGADLGSLEQLITPRTRAIIDIPMWGYPTPAEELQRLAKTRGIPLIFDLAHSHGTTFAGQPLSAYADLSCFSTHERKILSTGEGGFILSDDEAILGRCRSYTRFGNLNGQDFGLNYKLGALQAALGTARLESMSVQLELRSENARKIAAQIRHPAVREFRILPNSSPSYYFMLIESDLADTQRFIDHLDAHGIPSDIKRYGCRNLYEFPLLSAYRRDCPNASALLKRITTLPVHPGISDTDIAHMAEAINAYTGT
ncbi:DegT/DnrJ/EryC1/StrS family aminotransferase [Myxococcus vastator]|uniref:DegT/DnrJ/EryC1/StrS family aminotransferase n=1 Tax=Myxococcus vastator TaxID=2709664 RepID=UPI0013D686B5|nr:aminotransferase class I/II-fold pyridoxal phosphate-dependent enzyme [Myxococcus vastator]